MATMIPLPDPQPAIRVGAIDVIATEATRTEAGITATLMAVNGTAKAVRTVTLPDPAQRRQFAEDVAHVTGGDVVDFERTVIELAPFVEAQLRQAPPPEPDWTAPVAFHTLALPVFPLEALPESLRAYVQSVATATQTPSDAVAMMALAVLATACAKKFEVRLWDGWTEPTNVFIVVILDPGNRKTAIVIELTQPLADWEQEQARAKGPSIAEAQTKRKILEASLAQAEGLAAKSDPEQRAELTAQAVALAKELATTRVEVAPRLLADECTPERLATLLRDHGGRQSVLTAEGGEVFELFTGRYGNGANLGVLLKGHAGDDLRIDRVGRPAEFVHRPALTLGLMVQHEVVRSLADQPVLRGRGVLGRLLFSSPSSPLGQRVVRPDAVDATRREAYAGMVKSILDLPYAAILAPDGTATEAPYPLTLDEAALARFEGFVAWLEPQLADEGDLAAMTDWAGKLAGAVARIAGLLHVAAHGAQARTLPIADPTIASAIAIGKYLIPHARAAFAEMGVDADVEAAKRILRWIERTSVAHFTRRDVFEGTKGHFKRVDVLAGPLKLLADHGYIRERATEDKPHQPGQKRSPRYDVNPLWAPAHSANSANGVGRRSVTL